MGSVDVRAGALELTVAIENMLNRLGGVLFDQKMHTGSGPELLEAYASTTPRRARSRRQLGDLVRE